MKKWMLIPALAGVVVLGGVAMASGLDNQEVSAKEAKVAVSNQDLLPIEEVEAKAIEAVGGTVKEIELERKRSGHVYEVEVKSEGIEYDLKIDAKSGEILKNKKDDDDWNGNDDKKQKDKTVEVVKQEKVNQNKSETKSKKIITADEAIAIAMKQASGKVTELELDKDDGRLQYEIEIKDGKVEYEFEIDAYTGKVLEFEVDRDDDDDDYNDDD